MSPARFRVTGFLFTMIAILPGEKTLEVNIRLIKVKQMSDKTEDYHLNVVRVLYLRFEILNQEPWEKLGK